MGRVQSRLGVRVIDLIGISSPFGELRDFGPSTNPSLFNSSFTAVRSKRAKSLRFPCLAAWVPKMPCPSRVDLSLS